ncbi:transporter [Campylobacterota bacterium]|nr:transporter [Campylobacterota bacterium]
MAEETRSKLAGFPVAFFAAVMGFAGLSLAWLKASETLGFSAIFGEILSWITLALFVIIGAIYALKLLRFRGEVAKEFASPVRIHFFAAISISMLLIAMLPSTETLHIAAALWWIALVAQSAVTLYVVKFLIENAITVEHSSPSWFIPIVGNLVVPLSGIGFAPYELLYVYFSIGIFFWAVLFAIMLYRLIFHAQLAEKFIPTLFILIAPPAVAFLDMIKLLDVLSFSSLFFYNISLFFAILLIVMFNQFMRLKFFISWWAFTFPMAALSIATMTLHNSANLMFLYLLSVLFLGFATLLVAIVGYKTIEAVAREQICVEE